MKTFLTLDVVGVVLALVMGVLILFFGGADGVYFFLLILLFLVASALVTNVGLSRKLSMRDYKPVRGWKNVLANGVVPLAISFAFFLNSHAGFVSPEALVVAYVGSIAAIAADKFSSELGVFDRRPVMLVSLKKVRPGVSGGVSLLGSLMGVAGALVVGLSLFSFPGFWALLIIVAVSGVFGDFIDSFFGYFENRGFGNKYTSNLLCAAFGALVAVALVLLFV